MQRPRQDRSGERCADAPEFWLVFDNALTRVGFITPSNEIETLPVHVKYNGSTPWTLHIRRLDGRVTPTPEWQRIAEFFRPVYVKARQKWQR